MDQTSARWRFPLLQTAQAQKEITHNEALALIDVALQPVVMDAGTSVPPANPVPGASWIVGPTPSGAWADNADAIACWTAGGWRFVQPREGLAAWDAGAHTIWRYVSGAWERGCVRADAVMVGGVRVVGPQQPPIASASGGSVVDAPARAVLDQVLQALRVHGLLAA